MLRYLLDTDDVTLLQWGHAPLGQRLASQGVDAVGISVVTMEEVLRGLLARLARARDGGERIARLSRLTGTIRRFSTFTVMGYDSRYHPHQTRDIGRLVTVVPEVAR